MELWVSVFCLLAIVLLNSGNLLSRWFFQYPFEWTLEISLILFVYSVMFIVPALYKDKQFIQMHLIEDVISRKAGTYLGLLVDIGILAFLVYLLPISTSLSLSQTELLSRGLGIPRVYVTIPVPLGILLALPVCISSIWHQIEDLVGESGIRQRKTPAR
jgi:TRAP-type C4-dicarboxylate transport system permease small subunit